MKPAASLADRDLIEKSHKRFPENLPEEWRRLLAAERNEPYFQKLMHFLNEEYRQKKSVLPAQQNILRALQLLDYSDVKVVILGQDPYPTPGHAIGLCFAVPNEITPKPPSLLNIFKEIESDLEKPVSRQNSDLSGWTHQGVLLLNTVMTVRAGQPFSHRHQGWEIFTDKIIQHLSARESPILFLLWGAAAQQKLSLIDTKRHQALLSVHPSPLSAHRGFLGCKHFSKANDILQNRWGVPPIDWHQTSLTSEKVL